MKQSSVHATLMSTKRT